MEKKAICFTICIIPCYLRKMWNSICVWASISTQPQFNRVYVLSKFVKLNFTLLNTYFTVSNFLVLVYTLIQLNPTSSFGLSFPFESFYKLWVLLQVLKLHISFSCQLLLCTIHYNCRICLKKILEETKIFFLSCPATISLHTFFSALSGLLFVLFMKPNE